MNHNHQRHLRTICITKPPNVFYLPDNQPSAYSLKTLAKTSKILYFCAPFLKPAVLALG